MIFQSLSDACFFEGDSEFKSYSNQEKFVEYIEKALPKKRQVVMEFDCYLKTKNIYNIKSLRKLERTWELSGRYDNNFDDMESWICQRLSDAEKKAINSGIRKNVLWQLLI